MPDRPHMIVILSDEHFGGAMSHMGDPNVRTPHLDRLAAEGVSFRRAYANCPVCTPSRGTIFSGRHAHAGPVQHFFDTYKATAPSLATMLRAQGYRTAYFGKWHCGVVRNQDPPAVRENRADYPGRTTRTAECHRAGFEDWFSFEINNAPFRGWYYHQHEVNPRKLDGYQTDALTDLAIDYLQQYDRDQPLLLVLSVEPPHFPLEAPQRHCRFDPEALEVKPNFADSPEMRRQLALYYAMVENLDENIGRLMQALETLDRFRGQSIVSYLSDHGDFMGSHGAIERKEYPHEESVRIPYLFHCPGRLPAQGVRDDLISLVDFVPTVLGLLNVPVPAHVQGRDLSPAVRGEPCEPQDAVLLEMQGTPRWSLDFVDWRGLVTRRWKYCFYETGHEQLFDLEADPYEMTNLVADRPDVRHQLRDRLLALLRETREPFFDVLIEHGAGPDRPVLDVSPPAGPSLKGPIGPQWDDDGFIVPATAPAEQT